MPKKIIDKLNMKKIKLLFVMDKPVRNYDGAIRTMFKILDNLPSNFEVLVITSENPVSHHDFKFPYVKFISGKIPFDKNYKTAIPLINWNAKKKIKDFKPDIVHLTSISSLSFLALKYAKQNNIPVTGMYHSHIPEYIKYYAPNEFFANIAEKVTWHITRSLYNRLDIIYVPSTVIIENLKENDLNEFKIDLWSRGIDTNLFNPNFADSDLVHQIAGKDTFRILFVSRLVMEKDPFTLSKVIKKLKTIDSNIELLIVGDGVAEEKYREIIPEAKFLGRKMSTQLSKIYASCDIFLFPSSTTETFGQVIQEAMASGLPVVTGDLGGPKSIIKNEETGFIIENKDVDDFVNKVLLLKNNRRLKGRISKNARKFAESRSWDVLLKKLYRDWDGLVNSRQ